MKLGDEVALSLDCSEVLAVKAYSSWTTASMPPQFHHHHNTGMLTHAHTYTQRLNLKSASLFLYSSDEQLHHDQMFARYYHVDNAYLQPPIPHSNTSHLTNIQLSLSSVKPCITFRSYWPLFLSSQRRLPRPPLNLILLPSTFSSFSMLFSKSDLTSNLK